MVIQKYICIMSISAITITGCRKSYIPHVVASNTNYLVVEGVINSGPDSTIINLSRTVNIGDKISSTPEPDASVTIESDQNKIYPLSAAGNGKYASPPLNLNRTAKYRLHIVTAEGKDYTSDYETSKTTPPIDSVGFTIQNNGVQVYVSAHDGTNSTRYYRWDYVETWSFHAKYQSPYVTDGKKLNFRTPGQEIYSCYANNNSSTIVLGSSARLTKDEIIKNPIVYIASTSEKVETKYSILVKQYALTSEAYNFWQNLKKNTEQLGTIFDAQPSEVQGNVHCTTDPSEPVIGYVSVTNTQQKRIFISADQLPSSWSPVYPYLCDLDTLLYRGPFQNDTALFLIPIGTKEFAISPIKSNTGYIFGYMATDAECADCTIRGKIKEPDFWR